MIQLDDHGFPKRCGHLDGKSVKPRRGLSGNIPGFLLRERRMPVRVDNEVIGAVGVGGAPGGHLDDQCVVAALGIVKDSRK